MTLLMRLLLVCCMVLALPFVVGAQTLNEIIQQYETFNTAGDPDEAARAQGEEARRHGYPWLMAYSVATPLRDLPALAPREPSPPRTASIPIQTQAPAPKPAAKPQATCDSLWFQRNLIFHRNGYCFGGKRGQEVFGNDGCHTKSPTLSADETTQMNQIKAAEKELGCR